MQSYKELKVWQKAHRLVLEIYELTKQFPKQEMFGLTSQFRRASVSIAANLAEGCGKMSGKDTANFFQISLGSLHETEYYLLSSQAKIVCIIFSLNMEFNYLVFRILKKSNI